MRFRFLLLVFLALQQLHANNLVDSLQERMHTYNREKPVINLYVHLDRNIYTPEDTIWYKAYVLNPILNEVLYVRLTDRKKNIVLEKQVPMYDIRAHGDLYLPDTIQEGSYYFYAYTDRMISLNPNDVFVQPITVCKNIMNRLEAEASVTNLKKVHRGDKVEILTRVKGAPGKTLKGKYSLWVGERMLKRASVTTNVLGEAYVRFTYPKLDDTEMLRCEIRFSQDKDFAELILNLRHEGNTAKMNAYPEGGHLLENVPNRTVFEILDDQKNPLEVPLDLLENCKAIGSVRTDQYGLGAIRFTPHSNARYTLVVHENDTITNLALPNAIESTGFGISLETGSNKSTVQLTNRTDQDSATLVLRNTEEILWSQTIHLKRGETTPVDLPLEGQPKGVLNLAVFDSVSAPKADRLLLSKSEDPYRVAFSLGRTNKKGQKNVNVQLNIVDAENKPVATNFSVAIVERNTLDRKSYRTILQSWYFKNMFTSGSQDYDEHDPGFDDRLITMNWGLKSWRNLLRFHPTGYIRLLDNAGGITGQVTSKYNKPIKLDQLLMESTCEGDRKELSPLLKMLQSSKTQNSDKPHKITYTILESADVIALKSDGGFSITPKALLVNPFEIKRLKPGLRFSDEYEIKVTDYAVEMDEFVRLGESLNFKQPVNTFSKYVAPVNKTLTKAIQLKEVSVEARGGAWVDEHNMGRKEDYVCREYNVFNCKNHRTGGLKPIIGHIYVQSERGGLFVYNGVGKAFTPAPEGSVAGSVNYVPIKNITRPCTFYNPSTLDTSFLKAESRTTIYWAPNLYTNATGRTEFNCNTSDRGGDFTIIVQGIEVKTRRPFYGTYDFKL